MPITIAYVISAKKGENLKTPTAIECGKYVKLAILITTFTKIWPVIFQSKSFLKTIMTLF